MDKYINDLDESESLAQYMLKNKLLKKHWDVVDFVISIEASKCLSFYDQIPINDKAILLKYIGYVNGVLTSRFYSYFKNHGTVVYSDGIVPIKFCLTENSM